MQFVIMQIHITAHMQPGFRVNTIRSRIAQNRIIGCRAAACCSRPCHVFSLVFQVKCKPLMGVVVFPLVRTDTPYKIIIPVKRVSRLVKYRALSSIGYFSIIDSDLSGRNLYILSIIFLFFLPVLDFKNISRIVEIFTRIPGKKLCYDILLIFGIVQIAYTAA